MRFVWTPLEDDLSLDRLRCALAQWAKTPYESGQAMCGLGADCISSVFGVVMDWLGIRLTVPKLPPDTAMHNPAKAKETMRVLLEQFPHIKVEREAKPGDIVVMTSLGGGPQHVGIVGIRPNTMWHAVPGSGFVMAGFAAPSDSLRISTLYRITP